jgi:Tfp pilus assembly pilus retraction ATPase PilT
MVSGTDPGQSPQSVVPFLRALSEVGGSDLHIKVGSPPRVRIDGRLRKLQAPNLTPTDTEHMVSEVLRDDLIVEFAKTNEADFAYSVPASAARCAKTAPSTSRCGSTASTRRAARAPTRPAKAAGASASTSTASAA